MHHSLEQRILEITGANNVSDIDVVQSLWSDFGVLERVYLVGGRFNSIIVKRIQFPDKMQHPRGWNSTVSAKRKMQSYEIECTWYKECASDLPNELKVPHVLATLEQDDTKVLVMEDLMASGFLYDFHSAPYDHFDACLQWLAYFHAFHLGKKPNGLWETGTYWHLQTRQEEFDAMNESPIKLNAKEIDRRLNQCKFNTWVHGDAKPANFLFSGSGQAAAVDFQYVGGGCGMKDVIYLMSSSLSEQELFERDQDILSSYFDYFGAALQIYHSGRVRLQDIRTEWLSKYTFAWADFARFLEGWSPEHERRNSYLNKQVEDAIELLGRS